MKPMSINEGAGFLPDNGSWCHLPGLLSLTPSVLILDEATASLDIPSEPPVQHGLKTLVANRTAIIIAHRLSAVEIADRILVMDAGEIVEDGPAAQLRSGTGRFATLHTAWLDSLV